MMITRACISINNRCNLKCTYCHFREKASAIEPKEFNIEKVLDNIVAHVEKHNLEKFKLGFVGNGEPLLDYPALRQYVERIANYLNDGRIAAYTITNGLLIDEEMIRFFKEHSVNVGFSVDGIAEIHNRYRNNTHDKVMSNIELYKSIHGKYPSMNCTVGKETLRRSDETIDFFKLFGSRITFSRMIGKHGISLVEFHQFLDKVKAHLNVRIVESYDCTMYGGLCGAGMGNVYYANGRVYICGNCIDFPFQMSSDTELDDIEFNVGNFDRTKCYKEISR